MWDLTIVSHHGTQATVASYFWPASSDPSHLHDIVGEQIYFLCWLKEQAPSKLEEFQQLAPLLCKYKPRTKNVTVKLSPLHRWWKSKACLNYQSLDLKTGFNLFSKNSKLSQNLIFTYRDEVGKKNTNTHIYMYKNPMVPVLNRYKRKF